MMISVTVWTSKESVPGSAASEGPGESQGKSWLKLYTMVHL